MTVKDKTPWPVFQNLLPVELRKAIEALDETDQTTVRDALLAVVDTAVLREHLSMEEALRALRLTNMQRREQPLVSPLVSGLGWDKAGEKDGD